MTRTEQKERDERITAKYLQGLPYHTIMDDFDVSHNTIQLAIQRCGVELNRQHILTPKEIQWAVKKHKTGKYYVNELAKELDVDSSTLCKHLQANGIDTSTRHNYNKDCFEDMSTEIAAWGFGILVCDGCVTKHTKKRYYKLELNLARADSAVLRPIQDYIGIGTQEPYVYRGSNGAQQDSLAIHCHHQGIIERLVSYGMVIRKTWRMRWKPVSKVINQNNFRAFARGCFDANGCFHYSYNKKGCLINMVFMAFTKDFLEGFRTELNKVFPHHHYGIYKNGGGHLLTLSKRNDIKEFFEWLYADPCTLYMKRKHQKAVEMLKEMSRYEKRKVR